MLVHENALVKIRPDMPLDRAALIGCGVTTGLGAALNTAQVRPGDTAVVIGCGGVGLAAVQGCRIAGASRIVAVDTHALEARAREEARRDGRRRRLAGRPDAPGARPPRRRSRLRFECIGLKATAAQAVAMVRKGGTCVLVGVVPFGTNLELPGLDLVLSGKRVVGSMMGSNRFRLDMPRYVDFYLDGRLRLDEMISARLPLEEINTAFDKMKAGEAARSVITLEA